jgi:selenocysteine lyase/cysteine desulfurase
MPNYRGDFSDFAPTRYLDCAYQGPFPRVTVARIQLAIELKCHPERMGSAEYFDLPNRVRARLARLVGADPSEIALTDSVTQGIGSVVAGLDLKSGDEVVVASSNFPSNLFSWLHLRRRGVKVHVVKPVDQRVRLEDVKAALTPRTRVVALDWVSYASGLTLDLAAMGELVRRQGSLFVVDGSQGVGAVELNVHGLPVDVLAATGYKWLLGPYGTGFVYLAPEIQHRLDLQVVNWFSVEGSEDFDALPTDQFTLATTARIFDAGETANFLNLYGLEASLEYIEKTGVRTIARHCARLLDRLAEGLHRLGHAVIRGQDTVCRSAILGFQGKSLELTARLHQKLRANHVAVSLREGIIRVSPYLYNDESDIDRLLEIAS